MMLEALPFKQKLMIMIAVLTAIFFTSVNMTIVSTALPKIISHIGGIDYYDLVFSVYMLATTVTSMITGKLSDMYGRKRFILLGIGIFSVGSLLCGLSVSIIHLIAFRLIQGIGAGMILSSAFATIGELFSPRERGRWQGLYSTVFGLSSILGPTIGGYIVDHLPWQWTFWIFLPLGILAFLFIIKLYPTQAVSHAQQIDYAGAITIALFISSLLMAFSLGQKVFPWNSWPIISLFSLALVTLILFIYIETRTENPVLPLYLFRNKIFASTMLGGVTLGVGFFAANMYMPLFIQGVMGSSATTSGLSIMGMTIALMLSSTIAGQLMSRTGKYKGIGLVGLTLVAVGFLLQAQLEPDTPLVRVIWQLIVLGLGFGALMPVLHVAVQNAVSYRYLGVATASMHTFRQMGGTVGVAVMGTVMVNLMYKKLATMEVQSTLLASQLDLANPQILMDETKINQLYQSGMENSAVLDQLLIDLRAALGSSLTTIFLGTACLFTLTLIVMSCVKEIPLRHSNQEEPDLKRPDTLTQ